LQAQPASHTFTFEMSSKPPPKIAAVVVTHNRLALLKECVAALRGQACKLDEIIVVNNASDDGTREWLASQSGLTVIDQENLGSAGGQYSGLKAAYRKGHDWVWCMDDDSLPAPDALEVLTKCPFFEKDSTGFLGSLVLWKDGSVHAMNPPAIVSTEKWLNRILGEKCVEVRANSFVGVLFSRAAIAKVGFPIKEFFIWYDDTEYTRRISAHFPCYAVLDSKVVHQTKTNTGAGAGDQAGPIDNHSVKIRCYYRNTVLLTLLNRFSLARRLKHIAEFVVEEIHEAKSAGRVFAILRYSMGGVWLYWKIRKADLHR
jgi:rhamnopyranosyl-N-acetylglucosaminyl-diphospho-decaprenol beta-1,3/1,4-galactofuranosyltransferase